MEKKEDLVINYNAYNQVLEQQKEDGKFTFDKPVKGFILGDTSTAKGYLFIRGFQAIDQQDIESFYQVLHETPNFKLLKYPHFKTRQKRAYNEANTTVLFDLYEDHYLGYTTGQLQRIRKSKKEMLELFPKFEEQIEAFIQKEKLKFKDWNDVGTVLDFVETLF